MRRSHSAPPQRHLSAFIGLSLSRNNSLPERNSPTSAQRAGRNGAPSNSFLIQASTTFWGSCRSPRIVCPKYQTLGCPISRAFCEKWGFYPPTARTFIFSTDQSLTITGPTSPNAYARKLLQRQSSGFLTNPRRTGFRWMYRIFSTRFSLPHTLKS